MYNVKRSVRGWTLKSLPTSHVNWITIASFLLLPLSFLKSHSDPNYVASSLTYI